MFLGSTKLFFKHLFVWRGVKTHNKIFSWCLMGWWNRLLAFPFIWMRSENELFLYISFCCYCLFSILNQVCRGVTHHFLFGDQSETDGEVRTGLSRQVADGLQLLHREWGKLMENWSGATVEWTNFKCKFNIFWHFAAIHLVRLQNQGVCFALYRVPLGY